MSLLHINGSAVLPDEIQKRVLADELIWMDRLLQYHTGEIVDHIRNVVYDALHSGNRRKPYWQSVDSFQEFHGDVLSDVLHMEMPKALMADFKRRFEVLFYLIQAIHATEPVEEFDVDFREYLDQIVRMIHEFKHIASTLRKKEIGLSQAYTEADSKIIARAWNGDSTLSLVKHATTISNVNSDGSLDGRSNPVILEIGNSKIKTTSLTNRCSNRLGLNIFLGNKK